MVRKSDPSDPELAGDVKSQDGPSLRGDLAAAEEIARRVDSAEIVRGAPDLAGQAAAKRLVRIAFEVSTPAEDLLKPVMGQMPKEQIARRVDSAEIVRGAPDLAGQVAAKRFVRIAIEVSTPAGDLLNPVMGPSGARCERTGLGRSLAGPRQIEAGTGQAPMHHAPATEEKALVEAAAVRDRTGGPHFEAQRALAPGSRSQRSHEGSSGRMPGNAGTGMRVPNQDPDRVAGSHDLTADAEMRRPAPGAKAKVNVPREEGQTESVGVQPITGATHRR